MSKNYFHRIIYFILNGSNNVWNVPVLASVTSLFFVMPRLQSVSYQVLYYPHNKSVLLSH